MSVFNIATYTIQVFSPEPETYRGFKAKEVEDLKRTDKRVLANLPAMLEAVEEDLTNLLPEGYRAIIKEAL